MVDFRRAISPRAQSEIASEREKVMAFQDLAPDAMAARLLEMSRELIDSGRFNTNPNWSYDERALYRVVPEVARRLYPKIALRDSETPGNEERDDPVTWIRDKPDDAVVAAARGIVENGSFSRVEALGAPLTDLAATRNVLFRRGASALTVAADTLSPGAFPAREAPDDRAPLDGVYVVLAQENHDKVLKYCDSTEEANAVFDAVVTACESGSYDDARALGIRYDLERGLGNPKHQGVLAQKQDGTTLRRYDFAADAAPQQEGPEP